MWTVIRDLIISLGLAMVLVIVIAAAGSKAQAQEPYSLRVNPDLRMDVINGGNNEADICAVEDLEGELVGQCWNAQDVIETLMNNGVNILYIPPGSQGV